MRPLRYKLSTAARLLGVHPVTLRRQIHAGLIPYTRTKTGRYFLSARWVHAQMLTHVRQTGAEDSSDK